MILTFLIERYLDNHNSHKPTTVLQFAYRYLW
jgi:hypothetical protein